MPAKNLFQSVTARSVNIVRLGRAEKLRLEVTPGPDRRIHPQAGNLNANKVFQHREAENCSPMAAGARLPGIAWRSKGGRKVAKSAAVVARRSWATIIHC